MKAILEFSLPDERELYAAAVSGMEWRLAMEAIGEELRRRRKYCSLPEDAEKQVLEIEEFFWKELRERGLEV